MDHCYPLNEILKSSSSKKGVCPYDGIKFYTDKIVRADFWNMVKGASYVDKSANTSTRYKYMLNYKLFKVKWGKVYAHLPNTTIEINPSSQNISPSQLVDILKFIVGDVDDIQVGMWDDKVDITQFSPNEVAKRLYVPSQRSKLQNYKGKHRTYYYGKRNGQQVKVYDKANEMGIEGYVLTRIEKTNKVKRANRLSVREFLLNDRSDVFQGMNMVDIDKIDGRKKIKKIINKEDNMIEAVMKMSDNEKLRLKREKGFKYPCLDLQKKFQDDLNEWIQYSSLLKLKFIALSLVHNWGVTTPLEKRTVNPIVDGNTLSQFPKLCGWLTKKRTDIPYDLESSFSLPIEI